MTPEQKYIGKLYERAIDARLDVAQVAKHLAAHGVIRSTFQVADEIDRVYGFHGYATAHPAQPIPTLAQWDRVIGF